MRSPKIKFINPVKLPDGLYNSRNEPVDNIEEATYMRATRTFDGKLKEQLIDDLLIWGKCGYKVENGELTYVPVEKLP